MTVLPSGVVAIGTLRRAVGGRESPKRAAVRDGGLRSVGDGLERRPTSASVENTSRGI